MSSLVPDASYLRRRVIFGFTGDGKGVLSPMRRFSHGMEPFICAVPQWMDDWVRNMVFAPDGRLFAISRENNGIIYEVDYLYRSPDDFPESERL